MIHGFEHLNIYSDVKPLKETAVYVNMKTNNKEYINANYIKSAFGED
jgi:protein tyrosine phosphatase